MIEQPNFSEEQLEKTDVTSEQAETEASEQSTANVEVNNENPPITPENEPSLPNSEEIMAVLSQEIATLQQQLESERQQVETLKTRHITLAAEFDNFRKRTQKEKQELEQQMKGKAIREILSVVDNFERARTQIKPETDGEDLIHNSYQGVYKSLVDSLKRLGVSAMNPIGAPFDPRYHEAMLQEATNDYPEGTVTDQLVRGYLLGEQVLRHALVKVSVPKEDTDSSESSNTNEAAEASAN